MGHKNFLTLSLNAFFILALTSGVALAQMQTPPAQGAVVLQAPVIMPALDFQTALAEAYRSNPDLLAARAELRSVDETYAQAMSGYRPRVNGEVSYISSHFDGDTLDSHSDPKALAIELRQPLYRGGSTQANVKVSDNRIKAQRALLRVTEQQVLLDAVTAYMDVVRDAELVRLNINNENVLDRHLEASRQRFRLGDITKTDVSQAESRLANAVAGRVRAEGAVRASRARFEEIIGLTPERLTAANYTVEIPSTLDDALQLSEDNNPELLFAAYTRAAAGANTRAISGELLPQIDLSGSVGRTYDPAQRIDDYVNATSVGVVATIPLYTAGSVDARVRQARQVESQRRMEQQRAERAVRQNVVDAWTALTATEAEMTARKTQIDAAKLALDGVRVETDYGSRSTLDLLDAEQEYLDAQVAYVTAERNKVVALYRVLASVGDLNAARLKLAVDVYDPQSNFQKVKNRWIGTRIAE